MLSLSGLRNSIKPKDTVRTTAFAAAVFQDALGRPIDPASEQSIDAFLAEGGTRTQVAAIVLSSDEYRTDLVRKVLHAVP